MTEGTGRLERRGLARGLKISLDILFYGTLVVGGLLVVSVPFSILSSYDEGWDLIVPATIGQPSVFPRSVALEFESRAPQVIEWVRLDGRGQLHLFHHQPRLALAKAAVYLVTFGVILWALVLLRRILATTARGQPFHPDNPRRLNALGWVITGTAILGSIFQYLESSWALAKVEVASLPLSASAELHEGWMVCGLLVLVLSAIWKEGVAMADEQALTV